MAETNIKITADARQAQREIDNLEKSLESLSSQAADAALALGFITTAAAAVTYAISQTINAAGDIIDATKALGVSAESLQNLQYAARLAGVGADELNASLQRLSGNLGEALAKGSGPAITALERLNLPIREIVNSKPDEQFKRITAALLEIQNPAERTALAMDLFGKQGPRILAVAQELEKVNQITKEIGFGVTDRDLIALDEASDSVDQLRIIWDAGVKKAVAEIAPYIVAIVNKVKDAIKEAGGFDAIWKKIKETLKSIVNVMLIIATILTARLVVGAAAFVVQLIRAHGVLRAIALIIARTPIGLLAAAIGIAADKMGIDLVGGAMDFLDVNLDINAAQQQINTAVEEHKKNAEAVTEAAKGYNEEQKKAIEALDKVIAARQVEAAAQLELLKNGQSEANIKRIIAQEETKLLQAKINLNDFEIKQKLQSLELSIRQEELYKRIIQRQNEVNAAIKGMMDPDESARIEAYKKLQDAQEDYIQALAIGDKAAIDRAKAQVQALDIAYQNQIIRTARSKVEMLKIEDDFNKQIENLNANQRNLLSLGFTEESDLYKALQDEKLRALQDFNLKAAELEEARAAKSSQIQQKLLDIELSRIQRVLQANTTGMAQILSDSERETLQKIGQQERQKAIVQERINFEKKSELEKTQFAIQQGATIFSALGAQNKRAFEAAKAFNIANAVMNTYMAATKALATYPWPFGLVAAAAAVASGLAQVAQIRSQQYSGRALGGPVMGGTPYIVGESGPELFVPGTTGSIVRNDQLGGKNVTVNFQIVANDTTGFDQLLYSRRGMITQIINDAVLEKGKRSIA